MFGEHTRLPQEMFGGVFGTGGGGYAALIKKKIRVSEMVAEPAWFVGFLF